MLALMADEAWTLQPAGVELQNSVGHEIILRHWLGS